MKPPLSSRPLIAFFVMILTTPAFAWGERGHDLITRAAARLAAERAGKNAAIGEILVTKEHMLGHLSNVPDIVWRSAGKEVEDANAPTHYIDADYLATKVDVANLPKTIAEAEAAMAALCANPTPGYACPVAGKGKPSASDAGTAPWRVKQLFTLMTDALAKSRTATGDERTKAVDDAWLYAGIMAHFVGDLAQPYHATRDYDGWETDQGGVHSYFESALVSTYPLSLDSDVLAAARRRPSDRLDKLLPAASRDVLKDDPLALMMALVTESFGQIKTVAALDKKVAVVKPSRRDKGMKIKAERRDTAAVMDKFKPVITDRLALAADTLARLWLLAYERAGRPDLSWYHSWAYQTAPAFIKPDYLTPAAPAP